MSLGLGLDIGIASRALTGITPANFYVTNDSEFFDANRDATAGQIIQLQDSGTFTNLTLDNATGITVRGQTTWGPVLRSLTINGAQNATVTGLKIQANATPSAAPKLIDLRNNISGLVIDNCYIRGGNPWNSFADFDVTTTDTARMGTSGSFSSSSPYATDLWFGIGCGDGAFLPRGNVTIQNCTFLDLGSGIKFTRGPTTAGSITIVGNRIGRIYQDLISIITPSTAAECTGIFIYGNELFDAFSQPQDNGNPHSDVVQISVSTTYTYPFPNIIIAGNLYWTTPGCRGQAQRIFTNGYEPGYPLVAPIVVDNVMLSRVTGKGVELYSGDGEGSAWAYVRRNMMLARPTENALIQNETATNTVTGIGPSTVSTVGIAVGNSAAYGNVPNYIAYNLTEGLTGYATDRTVGNITTGQGTTANAYATWLDTDTTPEWAAIVDANTAITALTPKVAYAANSPIVSGETAATFLARWAVPANRPWSSMPSWTDWIDLSGVTISTVQTSEWAFVHAGGPGNSRSISISSTSGAEYRIADDKSGTNATSWTSSAGTIAHGKFLQLRQTASSSGSTAMTADVTIGSETMQWSVTTASTAAFPIVSIEGTTPDLFRISGASTLGSNGQLFTAALMKFKMSARPAAERVIFGSSSGTARVRISVLTTGRIRFRVANAAASYFITLDSAADVCDGSYHDIICSLDASQATSAAGASVYVDGSSSLVATTWASDTISYSTSISSYQFGMPSTDTMEIGAFYLNTVARVDLTSPANLAKFTADQIATTGTGPTGSQPLHFLVGTAGQTGGWNDASGINRGSGSKFIKVGSASATDVSGSPWT